MKDIIAKAKRGLSLLGLKTKKNAPTLMVIGGVAGLVATTVLACKATLKVDEVLQQPREDLDKINDYVEEHGYSEEYTEKDATRDKILCYRNVVVGIAKLYAVPIALGVLSVTSILYSHKLISKRNAALTAAYSALSESFKDYRGNVIEKYGKEEDRKLYYGLKEKEIEKPVLDEDGNPTGETTTETVEEVTNSHISDYAKFFDECCPAWSKDSERNLMFLKAQQNYANDLLHARGYVFLNEVYDLLGIPKTSAGQIIGWIDNTEHGDGYIDFDIYDRTREGNRMFVNGHERSVLLDFNVDGPILDYIGK